MLAHLLAKSFVVHDCRVGKTALDFTSEIDMKPQLELLAPAKLNLFLELKSRRPDGFHELETVMASVNLYDRLAFSVREDRSIRLSSEERLPGELPPAKDNLVTKALVSLQQRFAISSGMDVRLTKRIPSQAGLGGASSDAATALVAGIKLWGINASFNELSGIAAELGSDVPFFLHGGIALCTGRGEIVQPIESLLPYPVLIAKPPTGLSTPEVFRHCEVPQKKMTSDFLLDAIARRDTRLLKRSMLNRLQPAAKKITDWVERIAQAFDQLNCVSHQLSGSGSCYFGLFNTWKLLRNASARLLQRLPDLTLYSCKAVGPLLHNSKFLESTLARD